MEWKQAVDLLASKVNAKTQSEKMQNLDSPVILNALTGWLDTTITEYTEGASQAFGRRVVFLFNNDYTLTIGTGITPTIAHLNEEIPYDFPLPFESMLEENWDYSYRINGWSRKEKLSHEDLANFLLMLSEETGEDPTLILPFEWKLEILEEDPWWDEDDEDYPTWIKLLELFTDENKQKTADTIGLSFIVCDDTEYMSEYCEYSRFERLTEKLEEEGWFVNLDEHCAACSSGTRKWWQEENAENPYAPEFMTWGQNTQTSHLPDGTFWTEVYMDDEEHEKSLKKLAADFGLDVGAWQEGEFEAEGSVIFGE
jgi:hypothetical protein